PPTALYTLSLHDALPICAGFTGGLAYVLDLDRDFVDRYNHELIDIVRISPESFDNYRQHLTELLQEHASLTGSAWSTRILDEFRDRKSTRLNSSHVKISY